jgi:hypothetical protein
MSYTGLTGVDAVSYDHPDETEYWDWTDFDDDKFGRRSIGPTQIVQVWENGAVFVRNREDRAGNWQMLGVDNGGRRLTIAVVYDPVRRTLKPISGWRSKPDEEAKYERNRRDG